VRNQEQEQTAGAGKEIRNQMANRQKRQAAKLEFRSPSFSLLLPSAPAADFCSWLLLPLHRQTCLFPGSEATK